MKSIISKPSIPILYLDTCFFIETMRHKKKSISSEILTQNQLLIDIIREKSKEMKLICPSGDQDEEYEQGKQYESELRQLQTQISLGISARHHYGVYQWQTQVAARAFVNQTKKVEYDYRCIFDVDPKKQLESQLKSQFLVNVNIPVPAEELVKRKKTNNELAMQFETMRQEKMKMKKGFMDWVTEENLGTHEVVIFTIKSYFHKLSAGKLLSKEDKTGLAILADMMGYLSHYSEKDASIQESLEFLKSEYFFSVPYIDVQSQLYASMWVQSGSIKKTDNFDFQQACQMLPFSSFYLTDSAFKHRLTSNPLRLDKKFDTKIYSMREVPLLCSDLSRL